MNKNTPLLNPDSIASLRELSEPGKDFFAEMAAIYLQQAPAKVKEMEAALGKREFGPIAAAAHQLKSSSGNLGALSLADLFRRSEEAAKTKDIENLLSAFPQLLSTFAAVKAELEKVIASGQQKAA